MSQEPWRSGFWSRDDQQGWAGVQGPRQEQRRLHLKKRVQWDLKDSDQGTGFDCMPIDWLEVKTNFQIAVVMVKFDQDGDGKLSYSEFKKLLKKWKYPPFVTSFWMSRHSQSCFCSVEIKTNVCIFCNAVSQVLLNYSGHWHLQLMTTFVQASQPKKVWNVNNLITQWYIYQHQSSPKRCSKIVQIFYSWLWSNVMLTFIFFSYLVSIETCWSV